MRFLLSYIAIPTYQIGHFFRKNHIWYALLSSRHDVKLVLDLVSRGLNRVVVSRVETSGIESKRLIFPKRLKSIWSREVLLQDTTRIIPWPVQTTKTETL